MSKPRILHMLTPGDSVSPFDVNMAADAGFDTIVPYGKVGADNVKDYIQDAIFSRPPSMYNYTGAFIGGWDVNIAAQMLDKARKAMVPPFEISLFADPSGAYTTSAALVALVEKKLVERGRADLTDVNVAIFGGGPVGLCAGVLLALAGGKPKLVRLTQPAPAKQAKVAEFAQRYGVSLSNVDGHDDAAKGLALRGAEVAITTAKEGIQVLSRQHLEGADALQIAADVNAVPPSGIEGLDAHDDHARLPGGALGIGALAIGRVKYKVQHQLLKHMLDADEAVILDLPDAFRLARERV